ncbi:hypothetical protein COTS27_00258 [Spirochaetota bacterium]|nr:hypothetical protein COTS27_00258 [Spirochaetota bacterium]
MKPMIINRLARHRLTAIVLALLTSSFLIDCSAGNSTSHALATSPLRGTFVSTDISEIRPNKLGLTSANYDIVTIADNRIDVINFEDLSIKNTLTLETCEEHTKIIEPSTPPPTHLFDVLSTNVLNNIKLTLISISLADLNITANDNITSYTALCTTSNNKELLVFIFNGGENHRYIELIEIKNDFLIWFNEFLKSPTGNEECNISLITDSGIIIDDFRTPINIQSINTSCLARINSLKDNGIVIGYATIFNDTLIPNNQIISSSRSDFSKNTRANNRYKLETPIGPWNYYEREELKYWFDGNWYIDNHLTAFTGTSLANLNIKGINLSYNSANNNRTFDIFYTPHNRVNETELVVITDKNQSECSYFEDFATTTMYSASCTVETTITKTNFSLVLEYPDPLAVSPNNYPNIKYSLYVNSYNDATTPSFIKGTLNKCNALLGTALIECTDGNFITKTF